MNCRWAARPSARAERCPGIRPAAIAIIAERTGLPFREAQNHFEAQAARDAVVFLSGALKSYAIALTKIANDIRWLGSGPRCGLGELHLPEVQPGSSIMPGKVNPVIAESLLMVCAQVIGHDAAISWGASSGVLELNMMMPVIAYDLLESIELLGTSSRNLAQRCIVGTGGERSPLARHHRTVARAGDGIDAGNRLRTCRGTGPRRLRIRQDHPRSRGGTERHSAGEARGAARSYEDGGLYLSDQAWKYPAASSGFCCRAWRQ